MGDGADGGGAEPGHAEEGGHPPHGHDQQQVQVEAGAFHQFPLGLADDEAARDREGRVNGGNSLSIPVLPGTPQSSLPSLYPSGPHVVICVSRKMRMKTKRAGTTEANIIQMGKLLSFPMGLINQPRADELVTSSPLGTFSFWMGAEMGE